MGRGNIGNVEAFHHDRKTRQLERVGQRSDIALGIDRAGQTVAGEASSRFCGAAQVLQHVAQVGRFFEIEFLGGFVHFVFDRRDHLAGMAFQKIAGLGDALPIELCADLAQPRRHLIGRRFQFALRRRTTPECQDTKFFSHEIERLPERAGVGVRAEVTRAVVFLETRQPKSRPFLSRIDFHDEEALVIAERDVVTRPIFLDEFALEQKRLRLALDRVGLEIPDCIEQGPRLDIGLRDFRRHEIRADALPQIARFANVDDATKPIAHQVDARLVRHFVHLFGQIWFFVFSQNE